MKNLIFLGLFFLSGCLSTSKTIDTEKLDHLMTLLEAKQMTMGTLNIAKDGKEIYSKSVGYRSVEEDLPASSQTRYRVGSITKVFTATLIFQLIEERKLSLDTSLEEYYPQIPNAATITVGNLLNHSSGLYNITRSEDFNPYQAMNKAEMLASIARLKPDFEPGTKSEYSNTNFIILGYLLEAIYRAPYTDVLKNKITSKLRLNDTYYGGPINADQNEAYSYHFNDGWEKEQETDMSLPHGAGALVSTARDLTSFIHALFNHQLITAESLALMTTQNNGMGYGLFSITEDNHLLYGHDGGIDGFKSMLIFVPEDKLAISYTANGGEYHPMGIVKKAMLASYHKPFELPSFEEIVVSPEELKQYVGIYESDEAPMTLTFIHKDGKLHGAPTGQEPRPLIATKKHQFKMESAGITLDFNPQNNSLSFSQGGKQAMFRKK